MNLTLKWNRISRLVDVMRVVSDRRGREEMDGGECPGKENWKLGAFLGSVRNPV